MKIYIIGLSGSGKSILAERYSKEYNVKHYDLDDIFWCNENGYNTKREKDERDRLLNNILDNDSYIIEGVYYKWTGRVFSEADKIILLDFDAALCNKRIKKRFLLRKLHLIPGKKETKKSVNDLIKWNSEYKAKNYEALFAILDTYKDKLVVIKNPKEMDKFKETI